VRLTIACPEAHIGDANDLAMVLGYGEPDSLTYGAPQWQDASGNRYAVCSLPVSEGFFSAAFAPLVRPTWDDVADGYVVNMAGANRAQALVVLAEDPQAATPNQLLAMPGDDALAALAAMGLTRIPDVEPI
jgi:hypothetical protein